jgi:DNA-binding NarL/FixJ family response regulator
VSWTATIKQTRRACRVLIVDDHEVVRQGVRDLVCSQPQWTVCGETNNGVEAIGLVRELRPDVVIVDISMPEMNGLEAIRHIREVSPEAAILVLTMHVSAVVAEQVFAAGALGFVTKSDLAHSIVTAVESVADHRPYCSPSVGEVPLTGTRKRSSRSASAPTNRLTPREREVLKLLAEGRSNKEVGVALAISVKTAETHRVNIMRKLGAHSIAELVRYAVRNSVIEA